MPIHLVDTDSLRKRGLNHEAEALDFMEALGALPRAESTPARPAQADESGSRRPASFGGAGGDNASLPSSAAQTSSTVSTVESAAPPSPTPIDSANAAAETGDAGCQQGLDDDCAQPNTTFSLPANHPVGDGVDVDPLGGIYSDRLRTRLEQEAFKSASGDAQATAVFDRARLFAPPERSGGIAHVDLSPSARLARISALEGAVPVWARNSPVLTGDLVDHRTGRGASTALAKPPTAGLQSERER